MGIYIMLNFYAVGQRFAAFWAIETALAAAWALPAWALPVSWHETVSPHFQVFHETAFTPSGFVMDLERLHNRLRRDLAMFAPWMAKERIKIYLYRGKDSYLRGEFSPPAWSNGVAYYQRRLIALYALPDRESMLQVLAHEMTHLLFESYWGEEHQMPPTWLNEGLAMLEEGREETRHPSTWERGRLLMAQQGTIDFEHFLTVTPKDLANTSNVTLWYVQAHALVRFLHANHTPLQFFNFCRDLRDGKPLKKALWQVYRYPTLARLEAEWRDSLKLPPKPASTTKSTGQPARGFSKANGKFKTMGFPDFTFQGLAQQDDSKKAFR